jgi:hypothetical protein
VLDVAIENSARRAILGSMIALATLLAIPSANARPAPLFVTVDARVPVRVQIALAPSHALPCDSSDNTMVFDGMVTPGVGLALNVEEGPLCVRHANDDFPESTAGESQLWIRRPARIALHAHAP